MRDLMKTTGMAGAALLVLAGCSQTPPAPALPTGTAQGEAAVLYTPEAQAGVSLPEAEATRDMETVQRIAERRSWARRADAFSLLATERRFEQDQTLERLISESGGFMQEFEVPDETATEPAPTVFPTPVWRLSGVIVSEGAVMAILDTGAGAAIVWPGQTIQGTNWQCVSIDTEKAVFRRPANELPNTIVVPLQGGFPGQMPGAVGGGAPGFGGGAAEGQEGMAPPPGFRAPGGGPQGRTRGG